MSDQTEYKPGPEPKEGEESAAKRPCLIMIKGDFIGQVYELSKDVTMIGRSDDVDLVLSDISISRKHAMVVDRVDGFNISDLGSTNGCWVNRDRVTEPTKLEEGDKVTLGEVVFKFTFQDDDDTQYHMLLRNMAIKDGLTRIYNKRYFSEVLEKEFEFNKRNRVGLVLVIFDIDHFKQINDRYGHGVGDEALQRIGELLLNQCRPYDSVYRFGGDEFAVIFGQTDGPGAVVAAERILERRRQGDCIGERIWADVLRAIEAMSDEAPIMVQ